MTPETKPHPALLALLREAERIQEERGATAADEADAAICGLADSPILICTDAERGAHAIGLAARKTILGCEEL